jgi:peptide/nickel transport system substrate-binding protein
MTNSISYLKHLARSKTLALAAAAVLGGQLLCGPVMAQAKAKTPKSGGTLTIGTEADPSSLDPLRLGSYVERQFAMAVFDTLFEVEPSGKIVPNLVASYTVSPDAKTYTLKLRQGVKFHDGTPMNAEAVVFNLDRVRNPANSCRCLANVSSISAVKAIDDSTVEIQLKAPFASLTAVLSDPAGMIASPTALKANPTGFGNEPVGTGPFKLIEWTKGARFIADKNKEYWREGRPYVDRLVYRGLQSNDAREATWMSGALDVMLYPSPKFITTARKDKRFVVLEPTGFGSQFIALNTTNPALSDVRVRRAIAHATNRDLVVKAVYHNTYKVATTPFGEGLPGLQPVKNYPEYNPAKAKALLAEYGKPVQIKLMSDNTPVALMGIQVLQQMWQNVGIKVELQTYDQARLVQTMLTHQFDSALFRWSGRPDPDLNVYGFFHSRNVGKTSSNYVQYANPELDKLLDAGREEMDPAKRAAIYNKISQLLATELPYIFIYYVSVPIVTTPKVHGITLVPDSLVRVADVWKD